MASLDFNFMTDVMDLEGNVWNVSFLAFILIKGLFLLFDGLYLAFLSVLRGFIYAFN